MTVVHERHLRLRDISAGGPSATLARKLQHRVKQKLPSPLKAAGLKIIRRLALAHRVALLDRVTFIGVTGSTGKTTTKDLIHAILSSQLHGQRSEGGSNINVHWTVLRTSPWHKYCVQEIAAAIR